jgi:hypothetical protein
VAACRWYLAPLIRPWRWRRYVPPKRRLTFNRLHGVISQKTELFITTGVRTTNTAMEGMGMIKFSQGVFIWHSTSLW